MDTYDHMRNTDKAGLKKKMPAAAKKADRKSKREIQTLTIMIYLVTGIRYAAFT